jgi:hypothetical protein
MPLFCKNKDFGVQSLVLKLVNNNCPDLKALEEGPRVDNRVELMMVVRVVPLEGKRPLVRQAFTTVTKEFSNKGVAVVLDQPRGLNQAILGFRLEGRMIFIRAQGRHLNPMGGGFFQLGFHLLEVVSESDYPELKSESLWPQVGPRPATPSSRNSGPRRRGPESRAPDS